MRTGAKVVLAAAATLVVAVAPAAGGPSAPTRVPVVLRWLQMVDDVHGYALSGQNPDAYRLLRTGDGGRSWTDVTPGGGTVRPSGPLTILGLTTRLFSTTLRRGVFAVERSDDGGHSWRRSLPFTDRHGLGIGQPFAVDARHLYVALDESAAAGSQGQVLYTSSDGGYSWRFVSRTDVSGVRPRSLPLGCDLFRTDDAGRHWQRLKLPFDAEGYQLDAVSATVAYAFHFVNGGSSILRTEDGGRSWKKIRTVAAKT